VLDLLMKLFGVRVDDAASITGVTLAFSSGIGAGWVVLLALALAAAVGWMYWRAAPHLTVPHKVQLAALRAAFLFLLVVLLLRPVLAFTVEGSVRRLLVVLVDGSGSMQIKDPRTEEADVKRSAMARGLLDPAKGLAQPFDRNRPGAGDPVARIDVVKAVLKNERLDLLGRLGREFDVVPYAFGRDVVEMAPVKPAAEGGAAKAAPGAAAGAKKTEPAGAWVDRLAPASPQTAIGDAVREILGRKRGQPLAGVWLLTDGANNSGSQPLDAAALARQEGVPLHVYGVGIASPRDLIVGNLFAQEVAFVKDEVPVVVRVRGQGMAGQSAKLVLKLNDVKVDEKEVRFAQDGEQVVNLRLTPEKTGEFELKAMIDPRDDEAVKDNNALAQRLRVVDGKIKVLLVEQTPRWEFKYLQALLLRDRRVEAKCVLFDADPALAKTPGSPYLKEFPVRKEELYAFDLVIFGDVDPKQLQPAQLEALGEFVSKFGGAFVLLAGRRFSPVAYRKTVIEKMLPVELETASFEAPPKEPGTGQAVQLELTAAGKASSMLRLSDKEQESLARWAQLPPVYWVGRVARSKPAAEVLVVDPDPAKASRFGKMPVIAQQQYGLGQVMYIGTDNLWRWRRNAGDRYHTLIWGQVTQRLALPHLLGLSKRTQLSADRQTYAAGDRVAIFARLYNESYDPVTEPVLRGAYSIAAEPGGAAAAALDREVLLRPLPGQPGMYRGEFMAPSPGAYSFRVERDPQARLDFTVAEPRLELGDTAMNEALLKQMAEASGGAYYREESLHQLPDAIGKKTERVLSRIEPPLWSSPIYFMLLLAVVTTEWLLRKRYQLK
jgi:hypothetical protein